jgi:hypothetical protein
MTWTADNEDICHDIGLESQVLYMAHTDAYNSYRKYSMWFIIPTIMISSIIGGLSFSESFNSSETNKLVLGGFNIFMAILNSLFKILNIQDLETQHFYLSKMWYMLYEQIRLELNKAPDDRVKCSEFIKQITDLKMQLIQKNILIDSGIIKKYKNKYNKSFELPLSFKHLSPISIYRRGNRTPLSPTESII